MCYNTPQFVPALYAEPTLYRNAPSVTPVDLAIYQQPYGNIMINDRFLIAMVP
jgi:hypothetical protein